MDLFNLSERDLEIALRIRKISDEKFKEMLNAKLAGASLLLLHATSEKPNAALVRGLLEAGARDPTVLRQMFTSANMTSRKYLPEVKQIARMLAAYHKPLDPNIYVNHPEQPIDDELYSIFVGEDLAGGRIRRRHRRRMQGGFFSFLFN